MFHITRISYGYMVYMGFQCIGLLWSLPLKYGAWWNWLHGLADFGSNVIETRPFVQQIILYGSWAQSKKQPRPECSMSNLQLSLKLRYNIQIGPTLWCWTFRTDWMFDGTFWLIVWMFDIEHSTPCHHNNVAILCHTFWLDIRSWYDN